MADITREALIEINRILQEASWGREIEPPTPLTEQKMDELRHAYKTLLRDDYFQILEATLGKKSSLKEASEKMGLSEEDGQKLFAEALGRLSDFVEVSDETGTAAAVSKQINFSQSLKFTKFGSSGFKCGGCKRTEFIPFATRWNGMNSVLRT